MVKKMIITGKKNIQVAGDFSHVVVHLHTADAAKVFADQLKKIYIGTQGSKKMAVKMF